MKPSRTIDLVNQRRDATINKSSAISKNSKSSASHSRLRQPTPTSVTSRKSLESIRTNLMTSHYKTMRDAVKNGLKSTKNAQKENICLTSQLSTYRPTPDCKTPTARAKNQPMNTKQFTKQRFRF